MSAEAMPAARAGPIASQMGSVASVRMMKPPMKNEMVIAPKLCRKFAPAKTMVLRSFRAFTGTMASLPFFLMMKTSTTSATAETAKSTNDSVLPQGHVSLSPWKAR